jgi:hypothetical protein
MRSIAIGVDPTEHERQFRQLAQKHRNDGTCWNRRYAATPLRGRSGGAAR